MPDVVQRAQQKGARRGGPRLGLRDLRLDHVVVAQGALGAARDLVARKLDKSVEGAAGDAERHPGEPGGIDVAAAEGIKQARFARLGGGAALDRVVFRHERPATV